MRIHPKYQTFWNRFAANIIDALIFIPVMILLNIILDGADKFMVLIINFLPTLIITIYNVIGNGKFGYTVGKKLTGIQVLDINETDTIGYFRAFLRDSVWFFTDLAIIAYAYLKYHNNPTALDQYYLEEILDLTAFAWFILEFITMFLNSKRRALHDYMAGSVVVKCSELYNEKRLKEPGDLLDPIT